MDIAGQKKAISLLYRYCIKGEADVAQIPQTPYKTAVLPLTEDVLPRSTPEHCGVPSEKLTAFLRALEGNHRVNVQALTVVCDGAVICEASAPGYDRAVPHVTHSLCKSICGLAIGMLYDEGRIDLDLPVYRYFPHSALPARLSQRTRAITVRHLLKMSSGVSFGETGSACESDWVRAFFSAGVSFQPGTDFAYNSMNTYILAATLKAITGEGLVSYLTPRLFAPLGIRNIFWEKCPMGCEKGGWGLYISQEDIAKIGLLYLGHGVFDGRRLVSEEWIMQSTAHQNDTPKDGGDYDYAYQIWCARDSDTFLFNGMFGQNAWFSPRNRLFVITNAGNGEFFQKSTMLTIVEEAFGNSFTRSLTPLPANPRALHTLRQTEDAFYTTRVWAASLPPLSFFGKLKRKMRGLSCEPLPALCDELAGKTLPVPQNNIGILPLFVRLQQNNHTQGIMRVAFEKQGDRFFVTFDEGEGETYRIEAGFYRGIAGILTVNGECYRTVSRAAFAVDEEGRRLLKLELLFPELSHARRIKIFFDSESVCLRLKEAPGREILDGLLRTLPVSAPRAGFFVRFLYDRINLNYVLMKVFEKFEPTLVIPLCGDAQPPADSVAGLLGDGECEQEIDTLFERVMEGDLQEEKKALPKAKKEEKQVPETKRNAKKKE